MRKGGREGRERGGEGGREERWEGVHEGREWREERGKWKKGRVVGVEGESGGREEEGRRKGRRRGVKG